MKIRRKNLLSVVLICICLFCQLALPACAEDKAPFKEMQIPGDVWACDFDMGDEMVSYYTLNPGEGTSTYRAGKDIRLFDHTFGVATAFTPGDWTRYTLTVTKSGYYVPTIYYATPEIGVSFDLEFPDAKASIALEPSADYTNAVSQVGDPIYLNAGTKTMEIRWRSAGVSLYKIAFTPAGETGNALTKTEGSYRTHILPTKIQAEDFDLGSKGYFSVDDKNNGGKYRRNDGIDIYEDKKIGHYISLAPQEWVNYTFIVPASGAYQFSISSKDNAKLDIFVDDYPVPLSSNLRSVDFTEKTVETIYFTEGEHTLRLLANEAISLDWLKMVSGTTDGMDPSELTEENAALEAEKAKEPHSIYREFYLSPNGNDAGDGSEAAPFLTLARAREAIAEVNDKMDGDIIVHILPGTYPIKETQQFTTEHSGKNGFDVIFRGTNAFEKPVFHGGTEISGWEKHTDYIWKAPYEGEADFRNLYINGYMAQRARSKYRYRPTEDYTAPGSSNVNDGVGITQINFPEHFERPQDIELCWQNAWALQITPVADVEYRDGMVYFIMDQPYYNWGRSRIAMAQSPGAYRRFHIQNAMELLDEPGEFYYNKDEKMIYYYPFINEDLNNAETVVGTTDLLFSVCGEGLENKISNLVFDNLEWKYGSWNETNTIGMVVDQADKFVNAPISDTGRGGRMIPAQLDVKFADGIRIQNCEFSCLGSNAIAMSEGVSNAKIIGNRIHDISGSGIVIGHWDHNELHQEFAKPENQCSNIDILNNALVRIAYEYKGCIGISVYYEKNINILHNYLQDTAYSGMSIGWGWGEPADFGNIKISYNYIENPMIHPVLDGGHVYTLGPLKNSELSYNYFHIAAGQYGGIYPDSGSAYLNVHHNVVDEAPHWFFGGLYETHDLIATNNYSDTEIYYDYGVTDGFPGENSIEQAIQVPDGNWPEEARTIMAEAGLEPAYQRLLTGLTYPQWRTDFVKKSPSESFIVPDASWYEAEDYNDGGEGVGYHWNSKTNNQVYRPGDVVIFHQEDTGDIVVGGTYGGEWLKYDFDIAEDGVYELIMVGANGQHLSNATEPYANIYIDDVLVMERMHMQQTENWSLNVENNFGELSLTKGKHVLKVEFLDNGFSLDRFQFRNVKTKNQPVTTSPYYDELTFVYENPFTDITDHWAKNEILRMTHQKVIQGIGNHLFAPEMGLTKEHAMLLLMRSAGISEDKTAQAAVDAKLLALPADWTAPISREEFTAAIVKAYELATKATVEEASAGYADEAAISEAYYKDVMKAYALGIATGNDDGCFHPQEGLTRAEAATMIDRFSQKLQ